MSGDWRLIRVNPMSPDRGITGCLRKKEVALPRAIRISGHVVDGAVAHQPEIRKFLLNAAGRCPCELKHLTECLRAWRRTRYVDLDELCHRWKVARG